MKETIQLVAHRGELDKFPENSLQGFAQALEAGAAFLETDVQLTADGVVVLSHDDNLRRLTGKDISVTKNNYATFSDVPAGYPEKFGSKFSHYRIATLPQFAELLQQYPAVICFIEIKQQSLACFGETVLERVMADLAAIRAQSVIISFDDAVLVAAREKYQSAIGWVLPEWSAENKIKAQQLAPDYLFVDVAFCPENGAELWQGAWQWALYTVNDVAAVKKYSALGIKLIETNAFSELQRALEAVSGFD